ncbi:MAG: iron-sulfur cluster carrier protein MrpORP [Planctomycetota bacterium]
MMADKKHTGGKHADGCAGGSCGGDQPDEMDTFLEEQALRERMGRIRQTIMVMSGKGGVGKSTVAVNIAIALALAGKRTGLLDVDIHGPSIPKMLNIEGAAVRIDANTIHPVETAGLKVMSIGLLLRDRDDAVIWRGPMKMGAIKQFLKDVEWGDLDYLVIDAPPGTGDEPLSVCQLVPRGAGAVIVTTPQDVAVADVRRSVSFCHQLHMPVLGVVENMSGFTCPKCGEVTAIFKTGGGERMALDMGVPFLGRIPIDPRLGAACDAGRPFVYHFAQTETARALERVIAPLLALAGTTAEQPLVDVVKEQVMRIALPVTDGKLCMHFGHCDKFVLIDVDPKTKKTVKKSEVDAPEHQPGLLPPWLAERGVNVVIAGGMGGRAQGLFAEAGIKVVVGAPAETPEKLVGAYLAGTLVSGTNVCDH